MRGRVGEDERHRLARRNLELTDGAHVLAREMHRRSQHDHVGAGDGAQRAIVEPRDPGDDRAIAEPEHELRAHRDAATRSVEHANHVRAGSAHGHEVDERHGALVAFELRFQNQRIRPVSPRDARVAVARGDAPVSMVLAAEQRGETSIGIEPRPAQPIDRTIAGDERGRLAVADQRIILDG